MDLQRLSDAARIKGYQGPVVLLDTVESTNAYARGLADNGAAHGTAVFAAEQTAGRGRLGREWQRPQGVQLAFSVVLRPNVAPGLLPLICLGTGAAICHASPVPIRMKWPNDLMTVDGRKLGGILAEAEFSSGSIKHLVIGVGVNIESAPSNVPFTACMADIGFQVPDWADFSIGALISIQEMCGALDTDPQQVVARWRRYSATLGHRVMINGIIGIAKDIDVDGALLVEDEQGVLHRVLAGDVTMVSTNNVAPDFEPNY